MKGLEHAIKNNYLNNIKKLYSPGAIERVKWGLYQAPQTLKLLLELGERPTPKSTYDAFISFDTLCLKCLLENGADPYWIEYEYYSIEYRKRFHHNNIALVEKYRRKKLFHTFLYYLSYYKIPKHILIDICNDFIRSENREMIV